MKQILRELIVVGFLATPILTPLMTKDIKKFLIVFVVWAILIDLMIFQNIG